MRSGQYIWHKISTIIVPLMTCILLVTLSACETHESISSITARRDSLTYIDQLNKLALEKYEQSLDSTFHYIQLVTELLKRINYPKGKADLQNNLGAFYDAKGNTALGLRYYNAAQNLYQQLRDTSNIIQTYTNMAMVYQEIGNKPKSIAFYDKAVALGKHLSKDSIMSLVYYDYLLQYPDHFTEESTTALIAKIKTIGKKYNDQRVLIALDQLIADGMIDEGHTEEGFALLKQTITRGIDRKFNFMAMDILADLADRLKPFSPDSALHYYTKAYQLAKEKNFHIYIKIFTRKLYEFYKAQGDHVKALNYSDSLLALIDQQNQLDNVSGIDYVDYALKEKQLDTARELSAYNAKLAALISLICILALILLILLWESRKKVRKNQKVLRLQYEQAEAAKEALNKLNRNYDQLLKVVAHDLRNPIGVIFSISALLKQDQLGKESDELIGMIHMAAASSRELINKLLETDFDHQLQLKKETINLDELLGLSIQLLRYRATEKNQTLLYKGSKNLMAFIDKNLIIRVIDNLVVNAIKFSPAHSTTTLTLRKDKDTILITVKDNGIGIPEGIRETIFNPFTSAKRPGTSGETPFGLGLYLSRAIIEAHGGKLYLEPNTPSSTGTGSAFVIELKG